MTNSIPRLWSSGGRRLKETWGGPIRNRLCILGGPIRHHIMILGRPIRHHLMILGRPIRNRQFILGVLVLLNFRQESPLICKPIWAICRQVQAGTSVRMHLVRTSVMPNNTVTLQNKNNVFNIVIYIGQLDTLKLPFIVPYPALSINRK